MQEMEDLNIGKEPKPKQGRRATAKDREEAIQRLKEDGVYSEL